MARGSRVLPPPPTRVSAVALVGLCLAGEAWSTRASVARRLYPDSDPDHQRVALRQTLARLRSWLGADSLEATRTHVRLAPGFSLRIEDERLGCLPEHPWLDSVRQERRDGSVSPSAAPESSFARLVEEVAREDRDEARLLLLGGANLALRLSPADMDLLLATTRPHDRREPGVFGYLMLLADVRHRSMAWSKSVQASLSAEREANHRKSRHAAVQAMATRLFTLCELGQMGQAAELAGVLESRAGAFPREGEAPNALACFQWNSGDLRSARATMEAMERVEPSWTRASRMHYWANRAVLAGETRDAGLVAVCSERLASLSGDSDSRRLRVPEEVARARMWELKGDPASAAAQLTFVAQRLESGWPIDRLYVLEALAEMHARAGSHALAAHAWRQVHDLRVGSGCRLNPRYFLRRAAALGK